MMKRRIVKVAIVVSVLSLVLVGCNTSNTETTLPDPLYVGNAGQLPDGTSVELEGWIVVEDGQARLIDIILGVFPPAYDIWLDLHGVDIDTLDLFQYPTSSTLWSDRYWVLGTIQDGDIDVNSLTFQAVNASRQMVEDCDNAMIHPEDLGECSQYWFDYWQAKAGR